MPYFGVLWVIDDKFGSPQKTVRFVVNCTSDFQRSAKPPLRPIGPVLKTQSKSNFLLKFSILKDLRIVSIKKIILGRLVFAILQNKKIILETVRGFQALDSALK